jgi:hypothetical protein
MKRTNIMSSRLIKQSLRAGTTAAVIGLFSISLSSCKDDEPSPPKLSIESSMEFNEADGSIEIEVTLDKPATKDIVIEYSLGGDAVEVQDATNENGPDYEVTSELGEIEIEEGESTGVITIDLYSDFTFEEDETITITLEDVDDGITLTEDNEMEITLTQEDGLGILLDWGYDAGDNYTDVDMDLFLWAKNTSGTLAITGLASTAASFAPPEQLFLPNALDDGTYGLSCNYYEGSREPMKFRVRFFNIVNSAQTLLSTKTAQYTLANVNPWYTSDVLPSLSMTFEKTGGTYSAITEITVPASGSRAGGGSWPDNKKPVRK